MVSVFRDDADRVVKVKTESLFKVSLLRVEGES